MELGAITPLTVLLGPNGSGKSTVFDVFNFLSECFQFGLRHAWDRRGRARELKNFLHPRLLPGLAEECRAAADRSQLLVTTHSPFFLNGLRPEEVRVLYRNDEGLTHAVRAGDIEGVQEFMQAGATPGHLWIEGHFGLGDPLVNSGGPRAVRPRLR